VADERDRLRRQLGLSPTPTPVTADADPLAALQTSVAESKAQVEKKNIEIPTIALEQAVNTGDKNAIVDAAKAVAKAQGGSATTQASNAIEAVQNATPKPTLNPANIARGDTVKWVGGVSGSWQVIRGTNVVTTTATTNPVTDNTDNTGYKVVNGILQFNGQPFSGTYNGQTYENGKVKLVTDGNNNNATGYQEVGGVLQFNGKPFTGTFAGTVYENGVKKVTTAAVTATNTLTTTQQDIMSTVLDRLNRYNLGSLAPLIKKLAIEGASEATIMLRLQDEPLYQERFKANQQRIKKGISVLTPSEYLNLEDSYRQILRAYGLNQFDNDAYVGQFISNDVSPTELSNRVVTAVQRVRNADPAVSNMLKNYYGIGQNDLVAYVLDPNQQFQKIERQVAASEIGVAAGRQGINIGVPVAEQLAAQGITRAEAQRGYATIADVLPTAEKLSGIYGTTLDKYGLEEGEQEVFNTLASAQRKRQRLIGREAAEFSGQSGISRSALGTSTGGQY
jgi:hypothetical protein